MGILETYLAENYVKEKEQQNSVEKLIKKVIPIYKMYCKKKGWPYKLDEVPAEISTSTTAMVAFSMVVLMGGNFDLTTNENGENHFKEFEEEERNVYVEILNNSRQLIKDQYNKYKEIDGKKTQCFTSGTYGNDDPFTIMWSRYLIDNMDESNKKEPEYTILKEGFDEYCNNKVYRIFFDIYNNKEDLSYSTAKQEDSDKPKPGPIEKTHIFPLLKVVQIYYSMVGTGLKPEDFFEDIKKEKKLEEKHINEVRLIFENRLHYQLSLASIKNSNFDAAELIFSLEGMILLDPNRENFDQNLLGRVFQVIKEKQAISLYWRPLKPFVLSEQGLALLPLSVEIAMSLIRICRILKKYGEKLFSQNYEIFESYTEWIKTRVTKIDYGKKCNLSCDCCYIDSCEYNNTNEYYGWCSEHIYQPNVIHPWETSQVLVYLVNFNDMLQKHIAYQSIKYANLSTKYFKEDEDGWYEWEKNEPMSIEEYKVYEQIGSRYLGYDAESREKYRKRASEEKNGSEEIKGKGSNAKSNFKNKDYSMLLYGPPGTGKSAIAEKIATTKGWPLITITPSDFIANGADQVETKAKNIFKVLEEQKDIVVLFDEIDRLILDRDSKHYSAQSDIFQFMTPSMLVKLKDLRVKKKIIFIIATNYEERIDKAIKRAGRIDNKYLILPPDRVGRNYIFEERIKKENTEQEKGKKNNKVNYNELEKYKKFIVEKTAFFTFGELDHLLDEILIKLANQLVKDYEETIKKAFKEKSSITLMSYSKKIGVGEEEMNVQKPKKEFLSLVFLKAEIQNGLPDSESVFDKNEIDLIMRFFTSDEMLNLSGTNKISFLEKKIILDKNKELKDMIKEVLCDEEMTRIIISVMDNYSESRNSHER